MRSKPNQPSVDPGSGSTVLNMSVVMGLILEDNEANDAFDVLEWRRGNAKEFSILAMIAFDIYSIPAMSVEPARVFSGYVPENRRI